MLQAGRLHHGITIQAPTNTGDSSGQPIPAWNAITDGTNVRAEVVPVGGGERIRGVQIEPGITTVVTIRWRANVTPECRVIHGTRTLNIVRADDPNGRKEMLLLQCNEIAVST
jgi:SPP1 family predicted phage head-tail adaptor